MKTRVLLTGGGGAGTESLWKSLSEKYELFFADAAVSSIDPIVPISNRVEIPMANDESFIVKLKQIISDLEIDILVPGVDEELAYIAKERETLGAKVLLPDLDFIECMLDKYDCISSMKEKSLSVPKTVLSEDAKVIGFPQIVKPRSGRGSRGVAVVKSIEEVNAYKIFFGTEQGSTISQELGEGTEYTVLVAADMNAQLKAIVPVRIEQKRGITIRAMAERQKEIEEYCKKFQSQYEAIGIYNLQCILTENGDVVPFEINPRVSTTFCLSVAAGFEPFESVFGQSGDLTIFYPEKSYALRRNWRNHIVEIE
ncbi:ATP-grasp domain-containing protein [Thalassotalea fusca]